MTTNFDQTITADAFVSIDTGTPTLTSGSDITLSPAGQVNITSDLSVTGDLILGGNAYGGDSDTDSITFNADITSHIMPDVSLTYDLGSSIKQWNHLYVNDVTITNGTTLGDWTITEDAGTLTFAHQGVNKMSLDSSGNLTVVGDITAFGTV